ncbi:MAG: HupE/UreJ family protein [Lysobacter sp.]|nr:HupE/UreJ family protein [Lysobacter sp.]MDQ3269938.1 HupE/UreJ family protein [Pseudomonadota bacterium]
MRLIAAFLLVLLSLGVQAHTLSVSHLDVTVPNEGSALDIGLDIAVRDISLALPLDANGDELVTWGELLAIRPQLEDMVRGGLSIASSAGGCVLEPRLLATRNYDEGTYAHLSMIARCPSRNALQVRYRLLFDVDPQHRVVTTVRRNGAVATSIGRKGHSDIALSPGTASPVRGFLREGIHHILIGYDHLAFLISLLLTATLLRDRSGWRPQPGLRPVVLGVLGLVTAFTAAHSVTLSLAALGWVTPSSRAVEIAIAASVVLAALNNLRPVVTRRLWVVALVFGLIHGFGFAGALGELGLPDEDRLLSLVAFNLGVEVGQLAVVAIVLPLLFLVRRQPWYARWAMPAVSLAIAALGLWWLVARW